MTLPDDRIFDLLKDQFVLVYRNIERERHCGDSHGYAKHQTAVSTTNGAGARNVQMFVLSSDRVVLHALPGYWHPDDLLHELRFAQMVRALWEDGQRVRTQKEFVYRHLHRRAAEEPPAGLRARSTWQPFDVWAERSRQDPGWRDVFQRTEQGNLVRDAQGNYVPKPIDQIVHERMALQPFVPFDAFDVGTFVDLGQHQYDLNNRFDRGRTFDVRKRMAAKFRREEEREARRRRTD